MVRNFNSLLKEDNLKPIIIEGMNRAQIKPNQASALMSNLLPIIHEKIKILMGNASNKKTESQKQEEVSEEPVAEKKKFFSFKKKEKEGNEEVSEVKEEVPANPLVDKILMIVIGVCLIAIIGVLIFIVFKVNS